MSIKFSDIMEAFDFVSFGQMSEHLAYLDTTTGKIYWHSEFGDNDEELPDDINDEQYIEIPHKNELDLGKPLVFDFVAEHLSEKADEVDNIFRRKGAYGRYKDLLEKNDLLDKWYEYETKAQQKALREWCKLNQIQIQDE